MRQLVIVLSLCLAACGGQEPAAPEQASAPPSPQPAAAAASKPVAAEDPASSRALLDAYLQAWNQHDGAAVANFLAEDATVFDALLANSFRGRDQARQRVVEMYLQAVPDGQWSLRDAPVISPDGFSYEWTLAGTNSGNWTSYLRGRGQKLNFKGITIVRLKDGKIAYQANYFDTNALGAQAGW